MVADIAQQIESLTPADYASAFQQIKPAEHQLEMLRIHYAAPDHTLTARHLARGMGYKNWNAVNLHYGKFAAKICAILNLPQKGFDRVFVLAEFFKPPGSEVLLTLRPSVVAAIEQLGFANGDIVSVQEEIDPETPLVEGASYFVQVNAFERNPVARRKCIEHHGLNCSVCGFNFEANYGTAAKNYIHVHHLKPLASIGEEYVIDPIQDLRPVCSNCHSVIHLRQPLYSIEEVKAMQQCKKQQTQCLAPDDFQIDQ